MVSNLKWTRTLWRATNNSKQMHVLGIKSLDGSTQGNAHLWAIEKLGSNLFLRLGERYPIWPINLVLPDSQMHKLMHGQVPNGCFVLSCVLRVVLSLEDLVFFFLQETNTKDLKVFVGICIYLGLYALPMTELWNTDESEPLQPTSHHMAETQFFQLRRFFHISKPKQENKSVTAEPGTASKPVTTIVSEDQGKGKDSN